MKKRSRKRKRKKRFFVVPIGFFLAFAFSYSILKQQHFEISNEEFLKSLLEDSNYLTLYEKSSKSIVNRIAKTLSSFDIQSPLSFLETSFHYELEESIEEYDPSNAMTVHINDPNEEPKENPRVYIYNSHQLENYSLENLEDYNITPNVMMASYILEEKLNQLGISTLAEEGDITELMRVNGWKHSASYKASRYFIQDAIEKNPTLEFFIDLHRDAIKKEASTTTINGKNYAKVLFVVGTDYSTYEENLNLANTLNQLIKAKYPTLTRGVLTHGGKGYNGVYNQDLSPRMILLECGGSENTIEEVLNTMEVFANILKEYLGDAS